MFVSIGFDGHRLEEYNVNRVEQANIVLHLNQIKNAVRIIKQKEI